MKIRLLHGQRKSHSAEKDEIGFFEVKRTYFFSAQYIHEREHDNRQQSRSLKRNTLRYRVDGYD